MVNTAFKLSCERGGLVRYLFGETGLSWPTTIWNPMTKNGSTGLHDGTSSSWKTHKAHHLVSVHRITAAV